MSSKIAARSAGGAAGSTRSKKMRPGTWSMTKKAVPMTLASSYSSRARGTGTSLPSSARRMQYSRSTACARGSSVPGGFLRST